MHLLEVALSGILLSYQHTIQQGRQIMHSPQQCDAQRQPVCSRRIFLGSALAASASVVAGALAGCQRPSTLEVVQPTTGGGRDDLSDSVIGKDKIRIGMEAAYAPYNWQVSEASEYTIPIDNVQGAYADGYDVQIAKIVCKASAASPLPSNRASRALSTRSTTARSTSSSPV